VVNMTSRELTDWLRTRSAGEETEQFPDQAGSKTGRHVVEILQKRRVDLTADDERIMRKVVKRSTTNAAPTWSRLQAMRPGGTA
jgi:hypothetical protein